MERRTRRLAPMVGTVVIATALAGCGSAHTAPPVRTVRAADSAAAAYHPPPAGIATVQLFAPMQQYTAYVETKLAVLHGQLTSLNHAIRSGDLAQARAAWLNAHLTWLKIGQDDGQYGAFGTLGGEIDGLADGDVGGTASPKFTGFHRVELDLFRHDSLSEAAVDAARLEELVESITPRALQSDLALDNTSLDAWVLRTHEILEDALRDSLSENDDYGSNSDLASVGADVEATAEMLDVLSGLIEPRAPGLVQSARAQLQAIDGALAATPPRTEPSGLPLRTRQRIDGTVGAALETLAPVSELMQISNANT